MNTRGLTLIEVLVILAVIAILAALLLPPLEPGIRRARQMSCANNLRQLHQLATHHASTHPGEWPSLQEGGLWLSLTKCQPPILDQTELEVLLCPVKGDPIVGTCDYRGPRLPFTSMAPRDIVGADLPGNHGDVEGGTVLFKDGGALDLDPQDPLWKASAGKLFP